MPTRPSSGLTPTVTSGIGILSRSCMAMSSGLIASAGTSPPPIVRHTSPTISPSHQRKKGNDFGGRSQNLTCRLAPTLVASSQQLEPPEDDPSDSLSVLLLTSASTVTAAGLESTVAVSG